MANLTLSINSELLKNARKIAIDKDTTVNALVRSYIKELVKTDSTKIPDAVTRLRAVYHRTDVPVGQISWSRDELHER